VTAQGSPRSIFKRAIEHGNLMTAEITAREMGKVTLSGSLALTALVVQKDPGRRSRYAVRWLCRLLEEDENLTVEEAALAASALAALGGRAHEEAVSTLSAVAERATRLVREPARGRSPSAAPAPLNYLRPSGRLRSSADRGWPGTACRAGRT
jgi:hypothetical protein